jgi:syntaxin 5
MSGMICSNCELVAKRKTLFDDRPVEISELTYVIKQDLAALNQNIASLQALTHAQHPKSNRSKTDQEGEHNDNVSETFTEAHVH